MPKLVRAARPTVNMTSRPALHLRQQKPPRAYPTARAWSRRATPFGFRPETLLAAIESRFKESRTPRDLSLYYPMIVEAARGAAAVPGTGFNRLAHRGLLKRVVGSSFSRLPTQELSTAIRANELEAYNIPMGTLASVLRSDGPREDRRT